MYANTESEIERLFREAVSRIWPLPALVPQYPVTAGGENYRLDFALPSAMIGIELDGHATHSSPAAIAYDRRRKRNLEDAGWRMRYYGGQEVTRHAWWCVMDAWLWAAGLGVQYRPPAALPASPPVFEPVPPGRRVLWMSECDHVLCDDDGGIACDGRARHSGRHRCGDDMTWDTGFAGELAGRYRWDVTSGAPEPFELTPEQQAIAEQVMPRPFLIYNAETGAWVPRDNPTEAA
jgi:hypothetical protein